MDREETLVAQELATSSIDIQWLVRGQPSKDRLLLTCTVVECIKHSKQRADGKDVIVLMEIHLDELYQVKLSIQSLVLDGLLI